MASADLREELKCSICLNLYKEPMSLRCGHNFCRDCIVSVLDTQERKSTSYSCPECREQYTERPPLESNTMDHFRSAYQEKTEVFCTYCDPPVPASKTCLHCEASFCEKHLSNHSKAVHHVLIEPTTSFEDRKCSTHQEILKYYCATHSALFCMLCWVAGDHKGHQVELLNEASKKKLRDVTEKLKFEKRETDNRIQYLENYRTQEKGKAADLIKSIGELFIDIRKQLDDVENRVLTELSRQEEQISQSVSKLIQHLEMQKDKLFKKMNEILDLHKSIDPFPLLKKELISDDIIHGDIICDLRNAGRLDEVLFSKILHKGLLDFTDSMMETTIKRNFSEMQKSDILLDLKTASNDIIISKDLKSVSCSSEPERRPDDEERFTSRQVLSTRNFSFGRHYWEVDVSAAKEWLIGVAGHSIERKTKRVESYIGYNDNSWGLTQRTGLQARHNNSAINIESSSSIKTVGIYLDCNEERISFYQLCNPIRLLHTFITNFKEPLHAAFYVFPKTSIKIIK